MVANQCRITISLLGRSQFRIKCRFLTLSILSVSPTEKHNLFEVKFIIRFIFAMGIKLNLGRDRQGPRVGKQPSRRNQKRRRKQRYRRR